MVYNWLYNLIKRNTTMDLGPMTFRVKVYDIYWAPCLFAGMEGYDNIRIKSVDLENKEIEFEMGYK